MTWMFLHCQSSRSKLISILLGVFGRVLWSLKRHFWSPHRLKMFFSLFRKVETLSHTKQRTEKDFHQGLKSRPHKPKKYFWILFSEHPNTFYECQYVVWFIVWFILIWKIDLSYANLSFYFSMEKIFTYVLHVQYVCANYVCKHTFHFWNKSAHISLICF